MPNPNGALAHELLALYQRDGSITPEAVVDTARDPASPLHHRFEWDDSVAAEAHRRTQAQKLIREVKVELIRSPDAPPVYVRAFVHLPHNVEGEPGESDAEGDQPGAYYPYEVVASNKLLSRIALREMERRWHQLRRTYENNAEFWALIQKDVSKRRRREQTG